MLFSQWHKPKEFQKVLVRILGTDDWRPDIFCYKQNNDYFCLRYIGENCIPYNGNEHLVGTTKSPDKHIKEYSVVGVKNDPDEVWKIRVFKEYRDSNIFPYVVYETNVSVKCYKQCKLYEELWPGCMHRWQGSLWPPRPSQEKEDGEA